MGNINRVLKIIICTILISFITSYANDKVFEKEVYVNFVVLTKNEVAHKLISKNTFYDEIKILNRYFVTEKREKIFNFKFKNSYFYDEIKDSNCEFLKYGDIKNYSSKEVSKLYWKCADRRVRDPKAINFYIVDSYSKEKGYKSGTSHGKNAGNHPFVLIDYERLNHTGQSPEEHEMGHAFGLGHLCYENATRRTSTNIMASAGNCKGSGGLRDIGFNEKQLKTINEQYKKMLKRIEKNKND